MDDSVDISFGHAAVPDGLGIDDDDLTVITLIETARVVGPDIRLQTKLFDFLLQGCT